MSAVMKSEKKSLVFVHGHLGGSQQCPEQVKALSSDF